MCLVISLAISACSVTTAAQACPVIEVQPVTDIVLADTSGSAFTRRSLSAALFSQAATQEQLIGETMRNTVDNWFADTTVQLIANAGFGADR